MPLPVIAITNASTCLTDAQVEAVLPALQKQVSDDFKAYWDLDCTLAFLANSQPLTHGYWQIVIIDNPDQAGALGYHEMTSAGTPLAKVFAKLDLESGSSWTATLSHELLEMPADPWINWCAVGNDSRIYALEVCDAVEDDGLGTLQAPVAAAVGNDHDVGLFPHDRFDDDLGVLAFHERDGHLPLGDEIAHDATSALVSGVAPLASSASTRAPNA